MSDRGDRYAEKEELKSSKSRFSFQELELIERLAELEHEQWCHWMKYFEEKTKPITDMSIDEWYKRQDMWQRWKRLMITPYSKLTEKEKESDREWARKVLKIIRK